MSDKSPGFTGSGGADPHQDVSHSPSHSPGSQGSDHQSHPSADSGAQNSARPPSPTSSTQHPPDNGNLRGGQNTNSGQSVAGGGGGTEHASGIVSGQQSRERKTKPFSDKSEDTKQTGIKLTTPHKLPPERASNESKSKENPKKEMNEQGASSGTTSLSLRQTLSPIPPQKEHADGTKPSTHHKIPTTAEILYPDQYQNKSHMSTPVNVQEGQSAPETQVQKPKGKQGPFVNQAMQSLKPTEERRKGEHNPKLDTKKGDLGKQLTDKRKDVYNVPDNEDDGKDNQLGESFIFINETDLELQGDTKKGKNGVNNGKSNSPSQSDIHISDPGGTSEETLEPVKSVSNNDTPIAPSASEDIPSQNQNTQDPNNGKKVVTDEAPKSQPDVPKARLHQTMKAIETVDNKEDENKNKPHKLLAEPKQTKNKDPLGTKLPVDNDGDTNDLNDTSSVQPSDPELPVVSTQGNQSHLNQHTSETDTATRQAEEMSASGGAYHSENAPEGEEAEAANAAITAPTNTVTVGADTDKVKKQSQQVDDKAKQDEEMNASGDSNMSAHSYKGINETTAKPVLAAQSETALHRARNPIEADADRVVKEVVNTTQASYRKETQSTTQLNQIKEKDGGNNENQETDKYTLKQDGPYWRIYSKRARKTTVLGKFKDAKDVHFAGSMLYIDKTWYDIKEDRKGNVKLVSLGDAEVEEAETLAEPESTLDDCERPDLSDRSSMRHQEDLPGSSPVNQQETMGPAQGTQNAADIHEQIQTTPEKVVTQTVDKSATAVGQSTHETMKPIQNNEGASSTLEIRDAGTGAIPKRNQTLKPAEDWWWVRGENFEDFIPARWLKKVQTIHHPGERDWTKEKPSDKLDTRSETAEAQNSFEKDSEVNKQRGGSPTEEIPPSRPPRPNEQKTSTGELTTKSGVTEETQPRTPPRQHKAQPERQTDSAHTSLSKGARDDHDDSSVYEIKLYADVKGHSEYRSTYTYKVYKKTYDKWNYFLDHPGEVLKKSKSLQSGTQVVSFDGKLWISIDKVTGRKEIKERVLKVFIHLFKDVSADLVTNTWPLEGVSENIIFANVKEISIPILVAAETNALYIAYVRSDERELCLQMEDIFKTVTGQSTDRKKVCLSKQTVKCVKQMYLSKMQDEFKEKFKGIVLSFEDHKDEFKLTVTVPADIEPEKGKAAEVWVEESLLYVEYTFDAKEGDIYNLKEALESYLIVKYGKDKEVFWNFARESKHKVCVQLCSVNGNSHSESAMAKLKTLACFETPLLNNEEEWKEFESSAKQCVKFLKISAVSEAGKYKRHFIYCIKSEKEKLERLIEEMQREKSDKQDLVLSRNHSQTVTRALEFSEDVHCDIVKNSKTFTDLTKTMMVEVKIQTPCQLELEGIYDNVVLVVREGKKMASEINCASVLCRSETDKCVAKKFREQCEIKNVHIDEIVEEEVYSDVPKVDYSSKRHIRWSFPNGHDIVLVQMMREQCDANLLVHVEESDTKDGVYGCQTMPNSRIKKMKIVIPKWKMGENKEKDNVTNAILSLLKEAVSEDRYKIAIKITKEDCSSWPSISKYFKGVLHTMNDYLLKGRGKELPQMMVAFCCDDTELFHDYKKVFEEGIPKEVNCSDLKQDMTGDIQVVLEKGLLHQTKADVIVNTTDSWLSMDKGHISSLISKHAGDGLKQYLDHNYQNKIETGKVVTSPSFKLPNCKEIFHGALPHKEEIVGFISLKPKWNAIMKELEKFVLECLKMANDKDYTTIAFPALGTGLLEYPADKVAETMFTAVKSFKSSSKRSLKKVVFVIYHKDEDVYQKFQKEEKKFLPNNKRSISRTLFLGNGKVALSAERNNLQSVSADTIVYLWERNHMHTAGKKDSGILSSLSEEDQRYWFNHKTGPSRHDPFFTKAGHLGCQDCLHVPVIYKMEEITFSIDGAIQMADGRKHQRVAIYFDLCHPLLKDGRKLTEAVYHALMRVVDDIKYVKVVQIVVDMPENIADQIFDFFQQSCFASPSVSPTMFSLKASVTGMKDDIQGVLDSLQREHIIAKDLSKSPSTEKRPAPKPPSADFNKGNTGAGHPVKHTGREIQQYTKADGKTCLDPEQQWHPRMLDKGLGTDIIHVSKIPEGVTEKSLKKKLLDLCKKFEVHLVYCEGRSDALLVCDSSKEAEMLMKTLNHQPYQFQLQKPQSMSCFTVHIPEKEWSQIEKETGHLKNLRDRKIKLAIEKSGTTIMSATSYGLQYALELLNNSHCEPEDIVHFQDIKPEVFTMFEIKQKENIQKFKFDHGRVDHIESAIALTASISIMNLYKDNFAKCIESLKEKEGVEELPVDVEETEAREWCIEIEKTIDNTECAPVFIGDEKKILVMCEQYEDISKIKRKLQALKSGNIKVTGRGKRHGQGVASDVQPDDLKPNYEKRKHAVDFHWEKDAKNVKEFRTKEGIKVFAYVANITNLPVDCIVNAANDRLMHAGGVAAVIERGAGTDLERESREYIRSNGKIPVGEVCHTTAGDLPYSCVIHTVGPEWHKYEKSLKGVQACCDALHNAIMNSLCKAENLGLTSIALPAISSAIFGVPLELCVSQYAKATIDYSFSSANRLKEIHFIDIKRDVISSIQTMFERMIKNEKSSGVDLKRFVTIPESRGNYSGSGVNEMDTPRPEATGGSEESHLGIDLERYSVLPMPEVSTKKQYGKERITFQLGKDKREKLVIYEGDLLSANAASIAVVIDTKGKGGRLYDLLLEHIPFQSKPIYKNEVTLKLRVRNQIGDVIATGGCSSKYKQIMHLILPFDVRFQAPSERRQSMKTTYQNLFAECSSVQSVAVTLVGIKDSEVDFGAKVFLDSYLGYCMQQQHKSTSLEVHLVCREKSMFEITRNIVSQYVTHREDAKQAKQQKTHMSDSTAGKSGASKLYKNDFDGIPDDGDCVICMDKKTDPVELSCGHWFCKECIEQQFTVKKACPTCGKVHGIITGDQPPGTMNVTSNKYQRCEGYPSVGKISIAYSFLSGKQGKEHPNPGKRYEGINRTAYLPDNKQGQDVCRMLKVAFSRKLVFTIGNSRTTGKEGVITWNDIHHKTDWKPHSQFGYPDPSYLERVTDELSAKGVTTKDITENRAIEGRIETY